jgi:zinc transporter ZupT
LSTFPLVWLAFAVALLGAGIGALLGRSSDTRLNLLTSLATGGLFAVTCLDIFPEAHVHLSWPNVFVLAALGFAPLAIIGQKVFDVCPACGIAHRIEPMPSRRGVAFAMVAVAVGAHCLLDGVGVVAGDRIPGGYGLSLDIGILLHKLPEGIALTLLLLALGFQRASAFWGAALIQCMTLVGAAAGVWFLSHESPTILSVACALIGGGFAYLVFRGVISTFKTPKVPQSLALQAAAFAATALVLVVWPAP